MRELERDGQKKSTYFNISTDTDTDTDTDID
jgi:hypothetical protein